MWSVIRSVFGWFGHHEDQKQLLNAQETAERTELVLRSFATRFVVVVVFLPWIFNFFAVLFGWETTAARVNRALQLVDTWPPVYLTWLNSTVHACLGIVGASHLKGIIMSRKS